MFKFSRDNLVPEKHPTPPGPAKKQLDALDHVSGASKFVASKFDDL